MLCELQRLPHQSHLQAGSKRNRSDCGRNYEWDDKEHEVGWQRVCVRLGAGEHRKVCLPVCASVWVVCVCVCTCVHLLMMSVVRIKVLLKTELRWLWGDGWNTTNQGIVQGELSSVGLDRQHLWADPMKQSLASLNFTSSAKLWGITKPCSWGCSREWSQRNDITDSCIRTAPLSSGKRQHLGAGGHCKSVRNNYPETHASCMCVEEGVWSSFLVFLVNKTYAQYICLNTYGIPKCSAP